MVVGHGPLAIGVHGARRAPVQVDNGVKPGCVEVFDPGRNCLLVARLCAVGGLPVQPEPAVLVQGDTYRIGVPGGDGEGGGRCQGL